MKQIIFLIILLPLLTSAQKRDTVPLKKANQIVIETNRSIAENYQIIKTAFEAAGYTIDTAYDNVFTVLTAETRGNSYTVSYYITGAAKENEIILSGKYKSKVDGSIGGTSPKTFIYDISNTGKKGTASKFSFEVLDELARMIKGKKFYLVIDKKKSSVFN